MDGEEARVRPDDAVRANARWWDDAAHDYLEEHGEFLGEADLRWCPEGLTEESAGFLGRLSGMRVLEVGCGAAQASRWVARQGAQVVACDVSRGMLAAARALNGRTGIAVPLVQADARRLPFADRTFDVAFTAFGALPFVPDPWRIHREVARVLRGGGRWVFATSHPMRWVFADDPDPAHLRVVRQYFDAAPYVEYRDGELDYVEFQHTIAEIVNGVIGAGLVLDELVEPRWVEGNRKTWGSWSAARSPFVPGTLVVRAHRP